MSDQPEYMTVDSALRVTGVPLENHRFIKDFLHEMSIERVRIVEHHIIAPRPDVGKALNIANGSTNGFVSAE